MTRVLKGRPPNFAAIVKTFGPQNATTIYAYDGVIFSLSGRPLTLDLFAHEETHFRQQAAAGGAEAWWARYLAEPKFRLEQEIEAYRNQLAAITDRATRRVLVRRASTELAGAMYGRITTAARAKELLAA